MASLDGAQRHERFGMVLLPAVTSRAYLAQCHAELGTFAEGRTLVDAGLWIAEAVAHHGSLMYAYHGIGLLALRQGDLYWQRAGQRASQRSAHLEAVAHLTNGLELLATLSGATRR
jgi:hypothetical protein